MSAKDVKDRRKRLESLNLVSFLHRDDDGNVDLEVVGRTLDLSVGGILLEIPHPLPSTNREVEVTLGIQDNVIQTKGDILHQRELENGHYGLGISFRGISEDDIAIINRFLGGNGE